MWLLSGPALSGLARSPNKGLAGFRAWGLEFGVSGLRPIRGLPQQSFEATVARQAFCGPKLQASNPNTLDPTPRYKFVP